MNDTDFKAVEAQVTCHGLGFAQVKLGGNQRLHVWHPDLPRRDCFQWSPIHNHRFSFESRVLIGVQVNRRYLVTEVQSGPSTHDIISHNGPRSPLGGRESFVCGFANVEALPDERYGPGQSYRMRQLEYHETPNDGVVVTLMTKLTEGEVHANSLIERGHIFHQEFNRFMPQDQLWSIVVEALRTT